MANAWSSAHQQDYAPFAPDDPIPADQCQNSDTSAATRNCSCSICSRTRDADHDMTGGTIVYQDPSPPVESVHSHANQNAATVGYPTQAWSVAPQAPQYQENVGYAPPHEVVDVPQVQMDTDHDTTEGTIVYQDPSPPVESVHPHANQNAATVGYPTQAWSVAPQAPQYHDNAGYAPLHEVIDVSQVQMGTVRNEGALDLSAHERLRHLAGRYVRNPGSTVNGVHVEPGPSGRFQVVITIDTGDILGDTTN